MVKHICLADYSTERHCHVETVHPQQWRSQTLKFSTLKQLILNLKIDIVDSKENCAFKC